MRPLTFLPVLLALALLGFESSPAARSEPAPAAERYRSPSDVAVLPGGKRALTANPGSDSASLVDLEAGRVLAEVPCQAKPSHTAVSRDGRRAAVSNLYSHSVTLLEVTDTGLTLVAHAPVGGGPRGVAFSADGRRLFVALSGVHEVARLDWDTRQVTARWPAAGEPRRLSLSPDGGTLVAVCGRSGEVRAWEAASGKLLWERRIFDAFNLHGLAFTPDGKDVVVAYTHHRHNPITRSLIEQGWALNSRIARVAVAPREDGDVNQIGLDVRGKAVGDPCATAFSPGGEWLAATAAGTHELLVFKADAVPWMVGDAGDFLDVSLELDPKKYRRLPVGGRPLAVQFADADRAVVANALADAVQVVSASEGKVVKTVPLGGPAKPTLARQGEALFYDAERSHHHWFSCATCHPDGHTSGRLFDTQNDDSFGNPKMTLSLRGVSRTGPWTWHGWQQDLHKSVAKSFVDSLYGEKLTDAQTQAVVAFLNTLEHPPSPYRKPDGGLTEAAARGKVVFDTKGGCLRCHHGADFTSERNVDVKIEDDGSPFEKWSPPSLRGVFDRGPYLHDGRAETLEDVLRGVHAPERLGAEKLTDAELKDLVHYLKSL